MIWGEERKANIRGQWTDVSTATSENHLTALQCHESRDAGLKQPRVINVILHGHQDDPKSSSFQGLMKDLTSPMSQSSIDDIFKSSVLRKGHY